MTTVPTPPTRTRAALLFAASGLCVAGFIVWSVASRMPPFMAFDVACAEYWRSHGASAWEMMKFFSDLGGIATLSMVALMGAVWQFSHRHRTFGSAWFGVVVSGALLNLVLKDNFARTRPPEAWRDRAVLETNQSYPSGHAMGSVIGYGLLCYALLRQARFPLRRTLLVLFFASFVAGIGLSRIYLRAHWFSDVIGGYLAGLAWLCFWLGWLERRRRVRPPLRSFTAPAPPMQTAP